MHYKSALIILDGWGIGSHDQADGVYLANTPNMDRLLQSCPSAQLKTHGENVGLPSGQMGNSEVGHLNIGAGRVVYQDLARINKAVETDTLKSNPTIKEALEYASNDSNARIHLMGLLSEGGVHSSQAHLHALVDIFERACDNPIAVHAFTDGRDTDPTSGIENVASLQQFLDGKRTGLATVVGRYYAMDRDLRWERIKVAYDLLVHSKGKRVDDAVAAMQESYASEVTDEFLQPMVLEDAPIQSDDLVLCFNFRTDRCRQITRALTQESFPDHDMHPLNLFYVTMCRYDEGFKNVHVVFEKDNLKNTMGEAIADAGLTQLRMAETEKYPHVTFFFSGGREAPFQNEHRQVVPSPKVPTYDLQPEMSAPKLTQSCIAQLNELQPDFLCLNYANPDMVGHTGVKEAIIQAVETVDKCLGDLLAALEEHGYEVLIIADHGNADQMTNADGSPHTAHTTNLVPVIYVGTNAGLKLRNGILGDVAPTLLELMSLSQPSEMTGSSLIERT